MIQQVLSHYHLPALACAGLLLFMGVFIGAYVWTYREGAGKIYESFGMMPLQDEVVVKESQL